MTSSPRAPLILAVVIAAGFATRYLREGEAANPASTAALDSQLTRVQSATSTSTSGRSRRPAGTREATAAGARSRATRTKGRTGRRAENASPPPASRLRVERTPFGALPLEALAQRARDSARRAAADAARGRAVSAAARSPSAAGRRPRSLSLGPPTRPAGPAATIDLDAAPAEQIDELPGIGPALARRIVEDRERLGSFGSLAGLQRVRGIGPALARRLRGRVTFTGPGRP